METASFSSYSGSASPLAISSRVELARRDRVVAADAGADLAVGDALHLERVQLAEGGDLVERQRRILDQPDGRRFRHQRGVGHEILLVRPA